MNGQNTVGKAIYTGIAAQLNELGRQARCRLLSWSVRLDGNWRISGYAGAEYPECEVAALLDAWTCWLGLVRQEPPTSEGSVEYRGQVDGLPIEVWGVTNRDVFERDTQQSR